VHLNPVDRKSMNGNYPGDPAGTQTQRALAAVADQVVKRAGTVVDLHGGDLDEDLVPYSYWMRSGDPKADEASLALARAFGLERIIIEDLDLTKPPATRTLSGYTASLGKTPVVAEAGAAGVVDPKDVEMLVTGCLSILGALQMYDWPVHPVEHPVWLGSGARIRAEGPAIFTPSVRGGTYVSAGMRLGTLTDLTGRPAGEVRAPAAGLVTFIRPVPSVWKDATLANIAPVYTEPPPYRK
jgi:predicted deacylase